MKKLFTAFSTISFLLLLLVFPSAALKGAKSGLMLWFQTVLPTLLPFMIVSNLMMQLNVTNCLTSFLYPVIGKPLGLSKSGCYPFLIGMLSGYPVGAKACADLVASSQISLAEGQYLLCFCNNASPMFVISFIAMHCLGIINKPFLILVILYGSALLTGQIYRLLHKKELHLAKQGTNFHLADSNVPTFTLPAFVLLDQTILSAFEVLVKAGGYIILFSILAELVLHLAFLPATFRYFLIGFLELTTGSAAISFSNFSFQKRIVLTNALTSFGGLSSHAQTYSVIIHSELSIKTYFLYKCINSCITAISTLLFLICSI